MLETEYSGVFGRHRACWWPGSWNRQGIRTHGINSIGKASVGLLLCQFGLLLLNKFQDIVRNVNASFITRGQFWPSGIVVACVCVCVCVCLSVNHQLVRAITHQPFKLESPNLDQRWKRPWLRSLLFCGTIDLELQGQIELKSQNLPHFELVRAKSHHQLKSVFPNLGQKCILALLRSLLILGWIDLDVLFHF